MNAIKKQRKSYYYGKTGSILFFIAAFCILGCSSASSHGALNGLKTTCYIIIPSIFPFTVCSVFFQKSGGLLWVSGKLNKITKSLLNLSGTEFSVVFLSLLGGYPVGAKIADELYSSGEINIESAKGLLRFSINPSPAFIISVVGGSILNSFFAGIILFASNLLACLVLNRLFTKKTKKELGQTKRPTSKALSVSDAFVESVYSAAEITINICAFVILFSAIAEILKLALKDTIIYSFICPLLEISFGITEIGKTKLPLYFYAFFLCFGGVSTLCQIKQVAANIKPTFKYIIFHRLIHSATATALSALGFKIFPQSVQVFSNVTAVTLKEYPLFLPSVVLIVFSVLFLMFITDAKEDKKFKIK